MNACCCRILLALTAWSLSGIAQAENIYVLSGSVLLRVDSAQPAVIKASLNLTGLLAGESMLALDIRPQTGQLYGLGSTSRLYAINGNTGIATAVGSGSFVPALNGGSFGFDFDPATDQIRVVSDLGQNMRLNPVTGAVAVIDAPLHDSMTPSIGATGAAYTNNHPGAASTTLYVIDPFTDILYRVGSIGGTPQSPNDGLLTAVGPLNFDAGGPLGFDVSATGTAYAAFKSNGIPALFSIDLATGSATMLSSLPPGFSTISAIAVGDSANCSFDVDGNAVIDPLTDGLLILRAMFGLTGSAVTAGTIGTGATRPTWAQLQPFMNGSCGASFLP